MPTNKQRREAARRHLERQLERRIETDAKRKRRNLIITVIASVVVVVVVVVAMVALIHDDKKTPTAAASTTPAASSSAADTASTSPSASASTTAAPQPATTGPCAYTKTAAAATKDVGIPPDPSPSPTTARVVSITTNKGPLTMSLDAAATAPCAVQSVAYLAGKGYYDNTYCFRLVTTGIFVLQCGDAKNDGSGGPGYQFKDESLSTADYSAVGTIAMANSGPNTNGSQFFIIYKDSALNATAGTGLDPSYTVIGKVTTGMDLVQQVVAGGDDNSNPAGGGVPKIQLTFTKLSVAPPVSGSGTLVAPAASAPAASTPVASSTPAS